MCGNFCSGFGNSDNSTVALNYGCSKDEYPCFVRWQKPDRYGKIISHCNGYQEVRNYALIIITLLDILLSSILLVAI
jgi:hypothetical protein